MNIGTDKYLHALVCYTIVLTFACLVSIGWGVFFALLFAFGKEWIDQNTPKNKWDWYDVLSDCIGILLAILVLKI